MAGVVKKNKQLKSWTQLIKARAQLIYIDNLNLLMIQLDLDFVRLII